MTTARLNQSLKTKKLLNEAQGKVREMVPVISLADFKAMEMGKTRDTFFSIKTRIQFKLQPPVPQNTSCSLTQNRLRVNLK